MTPLPSVVIEENRHTTTTAARRLEVKDDELIVTPLGAGCEVGRSCILVEFRGRKVMLDCGIHPAHSGIGSLPIFEAVDIESVDLCLVTHFHLDHCGALPYFVSKTPFRGRVVMTEPTRAIAKLLWVDSAAMAKVSGATREFSTASEYAGGGLGATQSSVTLFDQKDIAETLARIETIDFRQTLDFKDLGISVTAYAAGHVLGACMFCVEIAGVNVLYTGDFSREVDRHLPVAEIPTNVSVHVLICESTYGIRIHEPRLQREHRFLAAVTEIVKRKGKCLLPVFALGRAQELLLMLEEHWASHKEFQAVPVWYASPMSSRSMIVFETFISLCGEFVQKMADSGIDPFQLKFVKTARRLEDMKQDIHGEGPCVVMAAPGMLQSGTSRSLFELWCRDKRNGVVLTGYSLRGTLADELKKNPHTLQLSPDGANVKIESSFEMISFSAHSDFNQSFEFIEALQCPNVVLVHGERSEVSRLSDKLRELKPSLAVFCPEVLQKVTLSFPARRHAKCLGQLAKALETIQPGKKLNTFLVVSEDATSEPFPLLVSPDDVTESLGLPSLSLRQSITCEYPHETLQPLINRLQGIFGRLVLTDSILRVEDRVDVCLLEQEKVKGKYLRLDWHSDPLSDLIADTISFAAVEASTLGLAEGLAPPAGEASRSSTENSVTPSSPCGQEEREREETAVPAELKTTATTETVDPQNDVTMSLPRSSDAMTVDAVMAEATTFDEETERDILEVVVAALSQTYDEVEVYVERSKKVEEGNDRASKHIMISLIHCDAANDMKERVIINFTERQVCQVLSSHYNH